MRKEVIAHKNPKSPISEIFRTLRTNIQFMDVNKKMKVLLVTSTFPGEGKSWVASNLAVTFAQAGKKVILIDSDMRKGRQYAIFGLSPKPGLSDFLSETEVDSKTGKLSLDIFDYMQTSEVDNLYVMTSGTIPPNPSELLVSIKMRKLLDELKEVCDMVIIDGTPSELVTDAVILSRIADSTVIVTAHKVTKKDALERVIKNIKNVGGNIAGVVINKLPISAKKYGERYYYYGDDRDVEVPRKKKRVKKEKEKYLQAINNFFQVKNEDEIYNEKNDISSEENDNNQTNIETISNDFNNEKQEPPKNVEDNNMQTIEKNEEKSVLEKTNDILNQINEYIEKEKKKM